MYFSECNIAKNDKNKSKYSEVILFVEYLVMKCDDCPNLKCPFSGCGEEISEEDKDIAIALLMSALTQVVAGCKEVVAQIIVKSYHRVC